MHHKEQNRINALIIELENRIRHLFQSESSGHDLHHLHRVRNLALSIQEKEGGDRLIVAIAAFLHDVHRIIEKETGEFCSPKDSLPNIRKILSGTGLSDGETDRICHCIEFHEEYDFSEAGKTVQDIETLVLQDADNLDAIGAIGIGRTFTFGGAHGVTMWDPEKPFDREHFDESEKDQSTIHHFHSKLFRLKDNMNTETGKRLAEHRHEIMESFVREFLAEWEGNQ
ncbi:MAG: HD domain-containing protein [Candidatus Moranbacteria bacterium]|nr:HD domain-containing protein [Candidatus Moranbacteria bacterium]